MKTQGNGFFRFIFGFIVTVILAVIICSILLAKSCNKFVQNNPDISTILSDKVQYTVKFKDMPTKAVAFSLTDIALVPGDTITVYRRIMETSTGNWYIDESGELKTDTESYVKGIITQYKIAIVQ